MEPKKFGYVRVSSKEQNEARQIESMLAAGISSRDIFVDKQSGKNFNRENYQVLKRVLRKGDILYIHSLDRFGRNKDEILNEWKELTQEMKIDIIVIDMPLLDTTKYKDSLGTFISDLVLQILAWMAEEERNRINKRQREGIDLALKRGVKFGRPEVKISEEFEQIYNRWKNGEITAVKAMELSGLKKTTFYSRVKKMESKNVDM